MANRKTPKPTGSTARIDLAYDLLRLLGSLRSQTAISGGGPRFVKADISEYFGLGRRGKVQVTHATESGDTISKAFYPEEQLRLPPEFTYDRAQALTTILSHVQQIQGFIFEFRSDKSEISTDIIVYLHFAMNLLAAASTSFRDIWKGEKFPLEAEEMIDIAYEEVRVKYCEKLEFLVKRILIEEWKEGHEIPIIEEPLSPEEQAIYNVIVKNTKESGGISTRGIVELLSENRDLDIKSTNVSKIHIPNLKKKRGVKNARGVGYYAPEYAK